MRRKFYELAASSPVAEDVLRHIADLYVIENEIRGSTAEDRRRVRDKRSRPIVEDLHRRFQALDRQVSRKSRLGEAIRVRSVAGTA